MENGSVVTSFILKAYTELEDHRYVYFTGFLLLLIIMVLANVVIFTVIYTERRLHEPMYFFVCNLAVNDIYGSISLFPSVLCRLMSRSYEISRTACLLQIFCLSVYASVEFYILSVMGCDRYAAICHPLRYPQLMSHRNVCALIAFSWIYPCMLCGLYAINTVQHTFCGRLIEKLYCTNFEILKLSCLKMSVISIVGLVVAVFLITLQFLLIILSYSQILKICLFGTKDSQMKALQTCTPHLLAVINYAVGVLFEVIQSNFNMSHIPDKARIFMSLYFLVFPPLLNPVVYGVSIQAIRVHVFKLFITCKNKLSPL